MRYARLGMCQALLLAAAVVSPAHAAAPTGRPLGAELDAKAESYLGGLQAKLPVNGQPLFDGGDLSKLRLLGQPDKAQYSFMPVEGQPFGQAVRVAIPKRTEHGWDVQVMTPATVQPLKKGEYVLAVFNARCIKTEGDTAAIGAYIQSAGPAWEGLGGETVIAGTNWKPVFILGQAKRDMPAGNYELTLHLGSQAQTLEIGGLLLLSLGMSVDSAKVPTTPIIYPGQEDDAPWRRAAAERIEKHRKADLTVSVVDKNGKPLPAATVRVEMTRHAYGFGTWRIHIRSATGRFQKTSAGVR